MAASAALAMESASATNLYSWKLDISYAINLLPDLVVLGYPQIIRYVEDIMDMSTYDVAADRDL